MMALSLGSVLTNSEVGRIHAHSLDLLERVGIDYKTPEALKILEKAGCSVDYERTWASLPRDLVEWALRQAPRVVHLEARDTNRDVVLDGRRSYNTTDSQGTQAVDLMSGELHGSTAEDLRLGVLFADALENVDIVNTIVVAGDVPAHLRTLQQFVIAFSNTSKPVRSSVLSVKQVPFLVEIVKAVTDSQTFRPIFSVVDCTTSPLMHDGEMTEACIELAKLNVPIVLYPMPLAGGTSPVTLAGTVLVHNVELLSALVLFQVVNPGTPIIYGAGASQLDMQTGRYGGSADGHCMRLALCEMSRFYHLPVNMWGSSTFSSQLDAQYGYEAGLQTLLAYLARADEIYSVGLLGSAQILSLEKMMLDNHLLREIEAAVKPMLVDEEHLQIDLIEQVGIGGNYLTERKTRDLTCQEYVRMWPPAGKRIDEVVRQEALDIYNNHKPPSLPKSAAEKLVDILAVADKELTI
jgi:trimethylamine--corrinoid protein Co-methyltransferase